MENRDTLAFLFIHFKQVVGKSKVNRMTKEALAKSVGPSIIGFRTESPDANEVQQAAKYQVRILVVVLLFSNLKQLRRG